MGTILDAVLHWMATTMYQSLLSALTWSFSMWMDTPSSISGPDTTQYPTTTPDGFSNVVTIVAYAKWVGLAICVVSLVVLTGSWVMSSRVSGSELIGRMTMWAAGVGLVSGGVSLVSWLAQKAVGGIAVGPVGFIQSSLWWIAVAVCAATLLIGGSIVAWNQRGEDLRHLAGSVATFLGTTAIGMSLITLGVTAGDAFSVWVMQQGEICPATTSTSMCYETLFNSVSGLGVDAIGASQALMMALVVAVGFIGALFQVVVFTMKQVIMVLMCGILPVASAFTFFQTGKEWFNKIVGWIVALLLYKPVAALIYATGMRMINTMTVGDNNEYLYGVALIAMASLALPMLMRLMVPATSAVAGGSGASGVLAAGAGAAMMLIASKGASSTQPPPTGGTPPPPPAPQPGGGSGGNPTPPSGGGGTTPPPPPTPPASNPPPTAPAPPPPASGPPPTPPAPPAPASSPPPSTPPPQPPPGIP